MSRVVLFWRERVEGEDEPEEGKVCEKLILATEKDYACVTRLTLGGASADGG
jgi:hypothetical protein